MKHFSLIFSMVLLTFSTVFAQKTVSGTVLDEAGEPLIGATVMLKGTDNGTVTDFDGTYSLEAKEGDVLVFSFTGYTEQEMTVGTSNVIDLTLKEGVLLTTTVVTALNIPKEEKSLGYAVTKIDGSDLTQAREANLVNSLSGKVAGAQITSSSGAVGASSRVVLRGPTSIGGSNQALFVVNGVPVSNANYGSAGSSGGFDLPNGIADINPDDIESITVLKGPVAAALYGHQASNGAIVITTKTGTQRKGIGIVFNSSTTFEKPLVLPDFQNSYGQGGSRDYFEFVDGQNGDGGIDESWGPPLDRGLEFVQWNSYQNGGAPMPWVSHPDNIKDFYDTGITANNNISFTGGNAGANFRLGLGMSNQKGIVPNTDFTKYNITGSSNIKLAEKLGVALNVNYIKSKSGNLPTGGYNNENPVQQMIWSGRNVNFADLKDYQNLPLAAAGTAAEGTPLNWNTLFQNNPYWVLDNNLNKLDRDRVMGNVALTYDITDYLSVRGKTSLDAFNMIVTSQKAKGSNENPEGFYSETSRKVSILNNELLLSYNQGLTDDIDLSLNFGGNMAYNNARVLYGEAPQLELAGLYNLSNVKSGVNTILTNSISQSRVNSLFGFGQIGFKRAIYLDFTLRNDWFSVLSSDSNSFLYPSVSLSAVVTELLNMNSKALSFLKIRGGWSKVGSSGGLAPYRTAQSYGLSTNPWGNVTVAFDPGALNNPNLRPEVTTGFEFGLDTRLFNDRISLDATYYNQVSSDILMDVEVSGASGYTSAIDNVATMKNQGVELELGITPIETKDIKLDLGFNFAKNVNEITDLGGAESVTFGGQWSTDIQAVLGQPYGVLVGPAFARNENGDIIYSGGLPTIGDVEVLGNIQPDWRGGITMDLSYKGIKLNTVFDAKIGGSIYSMTNTWGRYAGVLEETLLGRETGLVGDGVMNVGTADAPEWVDNNIVVTSQAFNQRAYSNSVAESSVFDASFVKWRQLIIGYQFPKKWIDKSPFMNAEISFVARNLAILHRNSPHIDPESAFSSADGEQGQEFGQLPSTRSLGFNLKLSF